MFVGGRENAGPMRAMQWTNENSSYCRSAIIFGVGGEATVTVGLESYE